MPNNTPDDVPLVRSEEVILGLSAGLGFLVNGLAIYVLVVAALTSARGGWTGLPLQLNQSLLDLTASVLAVLCFLAPGTRRAADLPRDGNAALFVCLFWNSKYFFWAVAGASKVSLLLLVWERYRAAADPFRYRGRGRRSGPLCLTLALLPWAAGFLLEGFSPTRRFLGREDCACHLRKFNSQPVKVAFSAAFLTCAYLLPLALMAAAYFKIYRTLSAAGGKPERTPLVDPKPRGSHRVPCSGSRRPRRVILGSMIAACLVFGLLWLPNQVELLLFNLNDNVHPSDRLYCAGVCLVVMSTFANPVIYTLRCRQFRRGLRWALPCLSNLRAGMAR